MLCSAGGKPFNTQQNCTGQLMSELVGGFFLHANNLQSSVLRRCLLGRRKGIRPVKNWVVGCWCGYVWVKVQICIWPSWCHCHSLSLAP